MVAVRIKCVGLVAPAAITFDHPLEDVGQGIFILCFMDEETET